MKQNKSFYWIRSCRCWRSLAAPSSDDTSKPSNERLSSRGGDFVAAWNSSGL